MPVAKTSKITYLNIMPTLPKKEKIVYDVICTIGPKVSNTYIKNYLGWDSCRVTGRTNKLVEKRWVKHDGYGKNYQGHPIKLWSVIKDRQLTLF